MAVILVSTPAVYVGASGDTKPTAGVAPGSIFYEFTAGSPPTVRKFMFDGTAWGLVVDTSAS